MVYHLTRLMAEDGHAYKALLSETFMKQVEAFSFDLVERDALYFAQHLGVAETELTRPLTEQEALEWSFYRQSAVEPAGPWRRITDIWEDRRLLKNDLAALLEISVANLQEILDTDTPHVLDWQIARKLADYLKLPDGPLAFLAPPSQEKELPDTMILTRTDGKESCQ